MYDERLLVPTQQLQTLTQFRFTLEMHREDRLVNSREPCLSASQNGPCLASALFSPALWRSCAIKSLCRASSPQGAFSATSTCWNTTRAMRSQGPRKIMLDHTRPPDTNNGPRLPHQHCPLPVRPGKAIKPMTYWLQIPASIKSSSPPPTTYSPEPTTLNPINRATTRRKAQTRPDTRTSPNQKQLHVHSRMVKRASTSVAPTMTTSSTLLTPLVTTRNKMSRTTSSAAAVPVHA